MDLLVGFFFYRCIYTDITWHIGGLHSSNYTAWLCMASWILTQSQHLHLSFVHNFANYIDFSSTLKSLFMTFMTLNPFTNLPIQLQVVAMWKSNGCSNGSLSKAPNPRVWMEKHLPAEYKHVNVKQATVGNIHHAVCCKRCSQWCVCMWERNQKSQGETNNPRC